MARARTIRNLRLRFCRAEVYKLTATLCARVSIGRFYKGRTGFPLSSTGGQIAAIPVFDGCIIVHPALALIDTSLNSESSMSFDPFSNVGHMLAGSNEAKAEPLLARLIQLREWS